jgi:hypothetical protein
MGFLHRFRRQAIQLCCCNRLDFAFGGERRDLVEDSPVGFGGLVVQQPAENYFRVQRYCFWHKRVYIEAGRAVHDDQVSPMSWHQARDAGREAVG